MTTQKHQNRLDDIEIYNPLPSPYTPYYTGELCPKCGSINGYLLRLNYCPKCGTPRLEKVKVKLAMTTGMLEKQEKPTELVYECEVCHETKAKRWGSRRKICKSCEAGLNPEKKKKPIVRIVTAYKIHKCLVCGESIGNREKHWYDANSYKRWHVKCEWSPL